MKTFSELEKIGIVAAYHYKGELRIISKNGVLWKYSTTDKKFFVIQLL